jgi:indolepyruvate ferredoxin oxidoreductase beta subunit
MKADILLSGVGGQGILSIAAVIGEAAVQKGLYLKQAEVHGMSQRGGDVQSNLRISDKPIYSDLISRGKADLIIALEPMEGLRYAEWLSQEGWLVTNKTPLINITNYPDETELLETLKARPRTIILDVDAIAKELGSVRVANMVMLGAATPFMDLPYSAIEAGITHLFGRKGEEVVAMNLKALAAGRHLANNR